MEISKNGAEWKCSRGAFRNKLTSWCLEAPHPKRGPGEASAGQKGDGKETGSIPNSKAVFTSTFQHRENQSSQKLDELFKLEQWPLVRFLLVCWPLNQLVISWCFVLFCFVFLLDSWKETKARYYMLGANLELNNYWLIKVSLLIWNLISQPIDKTQTGAVWRARSTHQQRERGLQGEKPIQLTRRATDWEPRI